jgi:aryl-alcohol dehydrogenase-like predicted oxidoreductase
MTISRVGFGAWAIGGGDWRFGWGHQDDRDSVAAIRRAVELGVNWIDTAPIYGLGHSEDVVGRALADFSPADRPFVFSKCGMFGNPSEPAAPARRGGDAASIRLDVEASLRRLKVERLDLMQMHWPPQDGKQIEDYWSTMAALQDEGKLRAIGLCNHGVELLERAEAIRHVATLQSPLSAIRRDVIAAELPWCAAHQTGFLAYSPMQSGLLSGSFSLSRAQNLPSDDWRAGSPLFSGEALKANLGVADAMGKVASAKLSSTGAVAIAWVLEQAGVSAAIVGARSAIQVDGWIAGANITLTPDDKVSIAHAIRLSGAGSGPVPYSS